MTQSARIHRQRAYETWKTVHEAQLTQAGWLGQVLERDDALHDMEERLPDADLAYDVAATVI